MSDSREKEIEELGRFIRGVVKTDGWMPEVIASELISNGYSRRPSLSVEDIAEIIYFKDADGTFIEFKRRNDEIRNRYLKIAQAIFKRLETNNGQ